MKKSWVIGILILGILIVALIAFNYQGKRQTFSLNDIFPEEKSAPVNVEYEFVQNPPAPVVKPSAPALSAPVVENVPAAVQAKTTPLPRSETAAASPASAAYTIQAASFQDKSKAEGVLADLTRKGHPAHMAARDLGEKGVWHRVYVGEFETKQEADQFWTSFKENYPNSFVIAPRKP